MDTPSCRSLTGQFATLVILLTGAASLVCLLSGCGGTQNETQIYKASKPPTADAHSTASVQRSSAYWNGWGFQVISFELTTDDGKRSVLTVKDYGFDKNTPDTYTIEPREHQVFAVRLDESWQVQPALTVVDGMPITLKAVYQVNPTRESTQKHVWTGRVESRGYNLSLWQCPPSCSPLFTNSVRP